MAKGKQVIPFAEIMGKGLFYLVLNHFYYFVRDVVLFLQLLSPLLLFFP